MDIYDSVPYISIEEVDTQPVFSLVCECAGEWHPVASYVEWRALRYNSGLVSMTNRHLVEIVNKDCPHHAQDLRTRLVNCAYLAQTEHMVLVRWG